MASAMLIVCETNSKWAVALRRRLPRASWSRICETRSIDGCWQQALAAPTSMVVLEATTTNLESLATALPQFRLRLPRACVAVSASRQLASAEWLLRELGAVHVVFSSRAIEPLVRIVGRHWSRVARTQPPDDADPWRRLPWGRVGDQLPGMFDGAEPSWLARDEGRGLGAADR